MNVVFQDKNVKAMFDLLDPLHEMIERGATTLKEQSFKQVMSVKSNKW